MALVEHATRELTDAGWFKTDKEDGMYDGMIGESVMELIRKFAEQGHSGMSAGIVINLFNQLARFDVINPMKNPTESGEYIDVSAYSAPTGQTVFQSTRKSSVFSEDGGKTWYDIDKRVPRWKRILGVKRHYLTFEAR